MAYSSAVLTISVLVLAGFISASAAPSPASWNMNSKAKHVYTDSVAEGQLSPSRRGRLGRCACFVQISSETNKTEWYCTADSDPRCRQLILGDLTIVQEKAMHQALASSVEEGAVHQCVCYLDVQDEANTLDFSCSNPRCYQLVAKKEVASANHWPHFECLAGDHHQSDPCCRCINNHWECNLLRQHCARARQRCSTELQVAVPGECCPSCLQASQNTVPSENHQSANSYQGSQQDEPIQSCECSVCKYIDATTGDLSISISRSHPDCQCDFQITYPYDDLATCSPKERAIAMNDKLEKELANWSG